MRISDKSSGIFRVFFDKKPVEEKDLCTNLPPIELKEQIAGIVLAV
jgi:hypothetical protein